MYLQRPLLNIYVFIDQRRLRIFFTKLNEGIYNKDDKHYLKMTLYQN